MYRAKGPPRKEHHTKRVMLGLLNPTVSFPLYPRKGGDVFVMEREGKEECRRTVDPAYSTGTGGKCSNNCSVLIQDHLVNNRITFVLFETVL